MRLGQPGRAFAVVQAARPCTGDDRTDVERDQRTYLVQRSEAEAEGRFADEEIVDQRCSNRRQYPEPEPGQRADHDDPGQINQNRRDRPVDALDDVGAYAGAQEDSARNQRSADRPARKVQ